MGRFLGRWKSWNNGPKWVVPGIFGTVCDQSRVSDQDTSLQDICDLVSGTREYVMLHDKWELRMQMESRLPLTSPCDGESALNCPGGRSMITGFWTAEEGCRRQGQSPVMQDSTRLT